MKKKVKVIMITIILLILFTNTVVAESNISIFGKNITLKDDSDPQNYVFSLQLLYIRTIST